MFEYEYRAFRGISRALVAYLESMQPNQCVIEEDIILESKLHFGHDAVCYLEAHVSLVMRCSIHLLDTPTNYPV